MSDSEEGASISDTQTSTPSTSFQDSSFQVSSVNITPPPKKRGRPPLYPRSDQLSDYSKSRSAIATALVLAAETPRRQSSRLQSAASPSRASGENGGKKTSHRTCEYCGVIKPTPAALQRHLRKHTGERPFVCQVCQKAYKAKRSLMCHQLSHHPELSDTNIIINSGDFDPSTMLTVPASAVSNLLKESLATRHVVQGFDLSDSPPVANGIKSADSEMDEGSADNAAKENGNTSLSPSLKRRGSRSVRTTENTQDFSANVSTIGTDADSMDMDGEEAGVDAPKRGCPHCHKEFVKPSDLKRHLMVHTGEKPYVCQFCKKGFKQPQSLNYHLKSAHKVDIPLSQGMEERYLRLKTRAAMRDLAALDSWTPRTGATAPFPSDFSASSFADSRPQSRGADGESHHQLLSTIPQSLASCSATFSPDFKQGVSRQTSVPSEGSWTEDQALGPNIIEVELPHLPDLDGILSDDLAPKRVPMMVKKETMLFTQLDGVCSITKQDMQVFRCCLCNKICASMYDAFSHLSAHFEQTLVGLECRACNMAFTSQPEMDDHYLRKHNITLNELDLQNNNHNFRAMKNGEKMKQSSNYLSSVRKNFQLTDDHNNNNDNHINKEHETAHSCIASPEPSSSPLTHSGNENSSAGFPDGLEASEALPFTSSKGAYRCPKCSKCYLNKFTLDRHVAFHNRQGLIEAAMKSGAKLNGTYKDLLLNPPPVVPQDGDRYQQLQALDIALKAQQQAQEEEDNRQRDELMDADREVDVNSKSGQYSKEVLETKALLEKEGIEEDVTVVIPADPDVDDGNASMETDLEPEVKDDEISESEIRSAPKRRLIPKKTETVPTKSRRKSSQPTRHRSARRDVDNPTESQFSSPTSTNPAEEPQQEQQQQQEPQQQGPSASLQAEPEDVTPNSHSRSSSPPRVSETPPDRLSESPTENDEINKEFQQEMLRAQQTGLFHNLHSAFNSMSPSVFGNLYPGGNGLLPPSSMTSAVPGYLRPFPSLPGHSPFSLHASSSVCTPSSLSKARPLSPLSPHSGNDDDQAEDLSLSSGSVSSPATSVSTSQPSTYTFSGHADSLVGFPRVLWDIPSWPRGRDRSPSPSPLSTSSSTANGKRLNRVWHTLSSEDLSSASATDGRKVTSLSRTHSRLYVVNQPVDRDRLCKPTVLPDGKTVFRCIFCHKDFLSYSDINRHMDFHEDIRPYKCNFCNYYARTNSQLKVHMMRHQGIREYCCHLCKYKGVTQSDLNRHMKSQIHLLKSQNECSKCGEGFVTPKTLEKHIGTGCKASRKRKEQKDE